jgi:putative (di)nucleoside polyphosphate hydrolase
VNEKQIVLDAFANPEFDQWEWVPYWAPIKKVVAFKQEVYRKALEELSLFVTR